MPEAKIPPAMRIAALITEVERCRAALVERRLDSQGARRAENDALIALNQVQKEFDAAVQEMRAAGPRDSEWSQGQLMRHGTSRLRASAEAE